MRKPISVLSAAVLALSAGVASAQTTLYVGGSGGSTEKLFKEKTKDRGRF
jgi:hypothetical protein